ncbi:serine hydrolase [Conexibacter sp. DBS9H8]|uniref:serine hydrolase n=1 Tax=Conexibacter sp. DBS9H8 TaxID=2937801 RepID=UPI00200F08C7|nr:serine hydrolase [Conexibacter sp. DBS9H8]
MESHRPDIQAIWHRALADGGLEAAWEVRLAGRRLAGRALTQPFRAGAMVATLLAALIEEDLGTGGLTLSRAVPVTRAHAEAAAEAAAGAGLLAAGQLPTVHRLGDLILLAVGAGDLTAAGALIAFLGGPVAVNARWARRGWSSALPAPGTGEPGAGSASVTLADHQDALAAVRHPLLAGPFAAHRGGEGLARALDPAAAFFHMSAAAGGARHDAGVLRTSDGPLWVGCLSDGGPARAGVDHPAWVAMATALAATLERLGLSPLTPER